MLRIGLESLGKPGLSVFRIMRGLRIILDKSVVFGLNNSETDSLDRYFFQVIPQILADEILADLAKEAENPAVKRKIALHSYRVSGNRGLTMNYRKRLANSLLGREIPMDGRFLASGETVVETEAGTLATVVETPLEDAIIARWERGEFTDEQRLWAKRFRARRETPLNYKFYTNTIEKAGLAFSPPESDEELIATVGELMSDRKLLPYFFRILIHEFGVPPHSNNDITQRWYKEGRKPLKEFAPYAFFCLRANFLWNLGLTNPQLFKPDRNDRKDLEYCYYLPNTELFASKDKKHQRLVPALLRNDQSFVEGDELKADLRQIHETWEAMSKKEKIAMNKLRGNAPPEDETSIVYQLWEKHRGELNPSQPLEILDMKLIDSRLPKEEQVPITFRELLLQKSKEVNKGRRLSQAEIEQLNTIHKGENPTSMLVFKNKVSQDRLLKWHPELTEADLDQKDSDD